MLREYIEGVRAEALAALKEGFRNGTARILTSTQEARVVVEATLEAKIKVIEETVALIQAGNAPTAQKPEPAKWPGDGRMPDLGNFPSAPEFERYRDLHVAATAEAKRQADLAQRSVSATDRDGRVGGPHDQPVAQLAETGGQRD